MEHSFQFAADDADLTNLISSICDMAAYHDLLNADGDFEVLDNSLLYVLLTRNLEDAREWVRFLLPKSIEVLM